MRTTVRVTFKWKISRLEGRGLLGFLLNVAITGIDWLGGDMVGYFLLLNLIEQKGY